MSVVCKIIHDVPIDAIEVQFVLFGANDCLCDHLRIAVLRFDMPILIQAEIQIIIVH